MGFNIGDRVMHLGTACCGYRKGEVFTLTEFKSDDCTLACSCGFKRICTDRFYIDAVSHVGGQPAAPPEWLRKLPKDEPNGVTFNSLITSLSGVIV